MKPNIPTNSNLSVLPFYTDIRLQNHRKSYAYGEIYPLYCKAGRLLPFQIMRKHRDNPITSVKLYTDKDVFVADITERLTETGMMIVPFADYGIDVIVYTDLFGFDRNLPIGRYYCVVTDSVNTWYSDIFTSVSDLKPYTKIMWRNQNDFIFDDGIIVYENPRFSNVVYLPCEIGKPEYEFEESVEDRDGYFFPMKQISEKTYRMTFLAPEYLCDAMRLIRMADFIRITDRYGRTYHCDKFLMSPKWETQGDLASVEVEFQTSTVAKKVGNIADSTQGQGDFNEDYNNDYFI